jgi:hypothetical protein
MNTHTNHHLNIFRYFNESHEAEFIENNLSRAFAICLQQDLLFFSEYIRAIAKSDDYEYLFSHYESDSRYIVDLQMDTGNVELAGINKIYAIAMTGDENLDMKNFMQLSPTADKDRNITDVWILIKDIVFIIEVKRTFENCKQQLYNQIHPLIITNDAIDVVPLNFSWPHTLRVMERVSNLQQMRNSESGFIKDFLVLCERRYPEWFPSKPFNQLPALSAHSTKTIHARDKRLRQIIQQSGEQILGYNDRMAISAKFGWASEIIPDFRTLNQIDYIVFFVWPGNTKAQGYSVYNKSLDWVKKPMLTVGGQQFELDTSYHMKFCHFNKYITALSFDDGSLVKQINTPDNFYHRSGKWDIEKWPEFELFMDAHFKEDFEWRKKCDWEHHFPDSDRNYFTVSFGFETELFVPYKYWQEMDKFSNDFTKPSLFIKELVLGLSKLIEK